jgi:hypothetical protein
LVIRDWCSVKNLKPARQRRQRRSITNHLSLITLLLLGGCGAMTLQSQQVFYSDRNYLTGANYLTFEHAFTDTGEADAKRRADFQCAQRKRAAVKTEGMCTLKFCITSYQCMTPEDAEKYQADGSKR